MRLATALGERSAREKHTIMSSQAHLPSAGLSSSSLRSHASHSLGFLPMSLRLRLPLESYGWLGSHVPARIASSTIRWWRRRSMRLRITMADETARRRTSVAISAVYDIEGEGF
jgi:hypothetical protein